VVISLDIYGGADEAGALDPLGRSLFADEKRQDKTVRQVNRIREESLSNFLVPVMS
jgi:hypothetical protein